MILTIVIVILIIPCVLLVGVVGANDNEESSPPFTFNRFIANDFFQTNIKIEASGVTISPDSSHLVIVSDDGKLIFINLLNDDDDYEGSGGHCVVNLNDYVDFGSDFEGVAIDTNEWRNADNDNNNMIVYVVHEGGAGEDEPVPYLYKIKYEYDPSYDGGYCRVVSVMESISLYDAIPCLETDNGIESLSLKQPSSGDEPAVFFVGIQGTSCIVFISYAHDILKMNECR